MKKARFLGVSAKGEADEEQRQEEASEKQPMKSKRSPKLGRREAWNNPQVQWTLSGTALPTALLIHLSWDPAIRMDTGWGDQPLSGSLATP